MSTTKKMLNNLKGADLSAAFDKLKEDDLIFRLDFSQISKHFLAPFLSVKPFQAEFSVLKEEYLQQIGYKKSETIEEDGYVETLIKKKTKDEIETAIKSEASFHKYICKNYFDLVKEPKEELLAAFNSAQSDINSIDDTLKKIDTKLVEIDKRKDTTEMQAEKPVLFFYREHNITAREEILDFMKSGIRQYALSGCYTHSFLSGLMGPIPYNYHWNPESYIPRFPCILANKFGLLTLAQLKDLNKLYTDDKPAFNSYLDEYIKREEIVFEIRELLNRHHLLNNKREIIAESLALFETGPKIMFALAVPTIIEGIFHDLCILTGETDNDLLQHGLKYKLDKLHAVLGLTLHYEYYAFRFRLFRNKVAHGRVTKEDVDEVADLLLLDLHQVCGLALSDKFDMNHKLFVIDELNKNRTKADYKYLLQYLLLHKTEIPAYYKLKIQIENVEKMPTSDSFWQFLESELDTGADTIKHGIFYILQLLSKRKPVDKRCALLFKKSGIKTSDNELANHYFKYLTRDF